MSNIREVAYNDYVNMKIRTDRIQMQIEALERKKLFLSHRCRSYFEGICLIDGQDVCHIQCTERGYLIRNEGSDDEYIEKV